MGVAATCKRGFPLTCEFFCLSFHQAGENSIFAVCYGDSLLSPAGVAKVYKRIWFVRLPAGRHFCTAKSAQKRLGASPKTPDAPERPLGTAMPSRSVG